MSKTNNVEKKLTDNAKIVLKERYLARDEQGNIIETYDDMFHRVADAIAAADAKYIDDSIPSEIAAARIEKTSKEFYSVMSNLDFLPNTPTLVNAGRKLGQLSACFVLPVEDSMEGIFTAVKYTAMIHKTGGGTGFSFSRLRSSGEHVYSTGGMASGPISFMKAFDAATETVKQGGVRRGANMGILRVDHPDIMQFITVKNDLKTLNNFNISVAITDKFIKALEADSEYDLIDPNSKRVTGTLRAKDVFDAIVDSAWRTGEPGIIFIDRINETNHLKSVYGEIESTNPCWSGDTLVLTENGYIPIKKLTKRGKMVKVWNGHEWSEVLPEVTGYNQNMYRVTLSDGSSGKCTAYHKFIREDGTRVEAKKLKPGTRLSQACYPIIDNPDSIYVARKISYTGGFLSGDHCIETIKNKNGVWVSGDKVNLINKLDCADYTMHHDGRRCFIVLYDMYMNTYIPGVKFSVATRLDWLSGLIDADGCVTDDGTIEIVSFDRDFLMDVKYMLNTVGTTGRVVNIVDTDVEQKPVESGHIKAQYKLIIDQESAVRLVESGLTTYYVDVKRITDVYKHQKNKATPLSVVSVEPIKKKAKKVYCFTEPLNHTGIFNGMYTGQCGEQPLLPYESCNLGSINLKNHFCPDCSGVGYNDIGIDLQKLRETIRIAVHFLDNVIDVNKYPIDKIEKRSKATRKIGLGVMGWADLLLLLGIPYNSEKAVELGHFIMKFINDAAHEESIELARQRGTYPAYNRLSKSVKESVGEARNATVTTIAPTGTISIIAGVSSGIEPVFAYAYYRRVMDDTKLVEANPILLSLLKSSGYYSDAVMDRIIKEGTLAHIDEIPEGIKQLCVCSHDISPEYHIRMQAAFQKCTDNAVSKTVNFPSSATREDVRTAYELAYKLGCKGTTIYRDRSREGQVLNIGSASDESTNNTPAENINADDINLPGRLIVPRDRPEELIGITKRMAIGCGKLYVTVNHDDRGICEIFTSNGKGGGCASQSEATARLASIALRAGVGVKEIIAQLRGIRCPSCLRNPNVKSLSCPDAIARVLEEAIDKLENKDDANMASEVTDTSIGKEMTTNSQPESDDMDNRINSKFLTHCPRCGERIEHEGGCILCRSCNWSKCG